MERIACIHNSFPAGGAERITMDIARHLSTFSAYRMFVYTSRIKKELLPEGYENFMTIRLLPSQAIQSKRSKVVEQYIVEDKINILVQIGKSLYDIEGIKERTGCKIVLACHGEVFWQRYNIMHNRQKNRLLWYLLYKRAYSNGNLALKMAKERSFKQYQSCDAYTLLCDDYRNEFIKAFNLNPENNHLYVIPNPEYPVDDPQLQKEKLILFVGRFENWSKRIDRLLRIWARVQNRLPDYQLVLLGDGADFKAMRQLSEDLKLQRISFEGRRNDVESFYRRASVVVLTSQTEGWPLALTEAQAQGCIGLAFDSTAGIREVLSPDGSCGFLVPPFDEGAYADKLLEICSMSEDEQLAIRKRGIVKRLAYTPEIVAGKWKSLFDKLYQEQNNGKTA